MHYEVGIPTEKHEMLLNFHNALKHILKYLLYISVKTMVAGVMKTEKRVEDDKVTSPLPP